MRDEMYTTGLNVTGAQSSDISSFLRERYTAAASIWVSMSLNNSSAVSVFLFLLTPLLSSERSLLYRATSLLPLPTSLVVDFALFVDARHCEHAKLAVVQQLTTPHHVTCSAQTY